MTSPHLVKAVAAIVAVSAAYLVLVDTRHPHNEQIPSNATLRQGASPSLSPGETSPAGINSSSGYRAFAIFTLPFEPEDDSNEQDANSFTLDDYKEAMRIMKSQIDSGSSHGHESGTNQGKHPHNYIIQSIRVIAKGAESDGNLQTESLDTSEGTTTQIHAPFEILKDSHKMITVQSLDNITDAVRFSRQYHNVTHILYDIEHWSRTPESEQENPTKFISKAGRSVHDVSMNYGITPDATFLIENYKQINWDEVDFLGMQLQRYSKDIVKFTAYVEDIASYVRTENPSIQIFVQLSFRFTDADAMLEAVEAARPWVDGYIIAYLPSSPGCLPNCNPEALDLVLGRIRSNGTDNSD